MTGRQFNGRQKIALYLSAGGKCCLCGQPLKAGWHADHVAPFVRGGDTDTINGQALCRECNLQKGSTLEKLIPWNKPLRTWQQEGLETFHNSQKRNFFAVATPGSGKTTFALRVAHHLLSAELAQRVVVVCPTAHLRKQWADASAAVGIHLNYRFDNANPSDASDYHGLVVTYQQVASCPDLYRNQCRRSTFAILDEIHHAAEERVWGSALQLALEKADYRLSLSGTPFRTDSNPIPFVEYVNGTSQADFTDSYGDALSHDVCRPVIFPSQDGRFEWLASKTLQNVVATFTDEVSEQRARERLRMAIHAEGDWMGLVLQTAHKQLVELRTGDHLEAGGLVIAMDMSHARAVAGKLQRATGIVPTLVISDDPAASEKITGFARSRDPWIVAVRMVSEGVDIPRLRVVVYATNILTEMYFRQAVGRAVRCQPEPEEQTAYFYIPADENLKQLALRIKQEQDHQLEGEIEKTKTGGDGPGGPQTHLGPVFITNEGWCSDSIYDEHTFSLDEQARAESLRSLDRAFASVPAAAMAKLLRHLGGAGTAPHPSAEPTERPGIPLNRTDEKKKLGKLINRLAGRIVHDTGVQHDQVYIRLMQIDGKKQPDCTVDDLHERISFLQKWLKNDGRFS